MLRSQIERSTSRIQSSTLDAQSLDRVRIEQASRLLPLALDVSHFKGTLAMLRSKYSESWVEIRYRYPHPHNLVVPGFVRVTLFNSPQTGGKPVPALVGFLSGVNVGAVSEWNNSTPTVQFAPSPEEQRLIAAGQIASWGMLGLMEKAGARCEDTRISLSSSSDHLTPVFGLITAVGIPSSQSEQWLQAQGLNETTAIGELPHTLHSSSTNEIGTRLGAYSKLRTVGGAEHGDVAIYDPRQLENGAMLYEVVRPEEIQVLSPTTLSTAADLSIAVGSEVAIVPGLGVHNVERIVEQTLEGVMNNEPLRAIRGRVRS